MSKRLKQLLDEEFKNVVNSDRAEMKYEDAQRVLDVMKKLVRKYPSELKIVEDAIDLLDVYEGELEKK